MIKKLYRDEKGMAAALTAVTMLMLIALTGLTVDGSLMMYNKVKLEAATEAAAHSTQCAYDVELWEDTGIVELDHDIAMQVATAVLYENFPDAVLESCEIDPIQKNVATLKAMVEIDTVFMRVFNIQKSIIRATVKNKVS